MAPFECFSPDALRFLGGLKANNTKDWFAANKSTYEAHLKAPGKRFADAMADALRDLTGEDHSSKIFRIHCDVRFSKDNTTYNANLHLAFTPDGAARKVVFWKTRSRRWRDLGPSDLALRRRSAQLLRKPVTRLTPLFVSISHRRMMSTSSPLRNAQAPPVGASICLDMWRPRSRCLRFIKFTTLAGILSHSLRVIIRIAELHPRVSRTMAVKSRSLRFDFESFCSACTKAKGRCSKDGWN